MVGVLFGQKVVKMGNDGDVLMLGQPPINFFSGRSLECYNDLQKMRRKLTGVF